MRKDTHQFNPLIQLEFMTSVLGKPLGDGIGRKVFESNWENGEGKWVIKIEDCSPGRFQNVTEWNSWSFVKGTKWAKWFAPIEWISSCGSVLIMRKTKAPIVFPEKMPIFLTDFKRDNYGMIDKQIVCHDYGTNVLMSYGLSNRMKKADWWD